MGRNEQFARLLLVNAAIVSVALVLYLVLTDVLLMLDFSGVIAFEGGLVFGVQRLAGVPVSFDGSILHYTMPAGRWLDIQLIPECMGISEMLLFITMILAIRGVSRDARRKGLAYFLPLIFAENIARLSLLYPMAVIIGISNMWSVHYVQWKFGQFAILMTLFGIWYLRFANKETGRKLALPSARSGFACPLCTGFGRLCLRLRKRFRRVFPSGEKPPRRKVGDRDDSDSRGKDG